MVINISMLFFHFLCLPIHGLLCVRLFLKQRELSVVFHRNDRQAEEFTTLLKEKDDQIAQLLEEGND